MPTPSGMPKVGEKIWLKDGPVDDADWVACTITRREGSAGSYSLWVKRDDGRKFRGQGAGDKILTEVPWWLQHGTMTLTDPAPPERTREHWENVVPTIVGSYAVEAIKYLRLAYAETVNTNVPDAQKRIANALLAMGEAVTF